MYSQISQQSTQLFSKFEKTFKTVEVNVGCKVTTPMDSPQPTSRGNSTEHDKLNGKPEVDKSILSPGTRLILQAVDASSQETQTEVYTNLRDLLNTEEEN